jgi:tetratricopeptide (TPR) repeat protein
MTVEIVLRQAEGLHLLGRVEETISVLLGQASRMKNLHDPAMAAQYYFLLGRSRALLGHAEAIETGSRAIEAAEAAADTVMVGKAHYLVALEHSWRGDYAESLHHAADAMRTLGAKDEPYWLGQTNWLTAFNHAVTGETAAALAAAARVCDIGRAIGDRRLESYGEWTIGLIHTLMGATPAGVAHCRRGFEYATDPHNQAIALGYLGYAYLRDGDLAAAAKCLEPASAQLREFGFRRLEGALLGFLAETSLGLDDAPRADTLGRQGLDLCQTSRFPLGVAWCSRALAHVALAAGSVGKARLYVENSLETLRSIGARAEIGRTLLVAAEVATLDGRADEAAVLRDECERLVRALAPSA